jgi:NADPH-dependent glutamate synthase beta subunit-like oxidoreductase
VPLSTTQPPLPTPLFYQNLTFGQLCGKIALKEDAMEEDVREFQKRTLKKLRDAGLSLCQAFCVAGCPIHQDNKTWLYFFRQGNIKAALDSLLNFNPLPSSISRICPKFCEKEASQSCGMACLEKSQDFRGSINSVEMFLGDWARKKRYKMYREPIFRKEKIAVIGAGPAGLACAYQLWHLGFSVTIFEKMENPGGILYFGISEERLPNAILLDEISLHLAGVEIKTENEINVQNFDQLADYNAMVISTGYASSKKLGIPGEHLPQVLGSLELLSDLNTKKNIRVSGKDILIIGGGETSVEAALTVINSGGRAKIIYRRGREDIGLSGETINSLINRGGGIEFRLVPREIRHNEQGRLEIKLKNSPDFVTREADFIVFAIGQEPHFEPLPPSIQEKIRSQDFQTLESRGIFVAGDLSCGQKNAAHAIDSGNETAGKIYNFLKKGSPRKIGSFLL